MGWAVVTSRGAFRSGFFAAGALIIQQLGFHTRPLPFVVERRALRGRVDICRAHDSTGDLCVGDGVGWT